MSDLQPKPGVQYTAWDTEPTGFGVRVSPAGTKTFIFKYRTKAGRVRWATLGRVGDVALDDARDRAYRMRGIVADGKDPLREIDTSRGALTVKEALTRYLAHVEAKRKPRTHASYQQIIDSVIAPRLGSLPVLELGSDDVLRLHHELRATPVHANRVVAVLSAFLSWSVKAKLRPAGPNPCEGVERYREARRRRYLTADEYARVGKALRDARKSGTIASAPLTAIELLLLTGARPAEITALEWTHVQLDAAVLALPDSKTGAKLIHLAPEAVTLLKKWPRWAGSPYVFPGRRRGVAGDHMHGSTLSHVWDDIREAAGLDDDVRLYDACRHSYASTGLSQHGLSLAAIGEQLGHAQPATTARYAHLHHTVAQQHATLIGGTIAKALKRRTK
ncbi:MAG: tyrosine-type recombinase/integrase [Acidobacteria bacterium]|nr:tyrosine-type recombinase/integrase [Acidobacteriota bacterium]